MIILLNLLFAFLGGALAFWISGMLGLDRRIAVIIAVIVGIIVFLANLGAQVIR